MIKSKPTPVMITRIGWQCLRCDYQWVPKQENFMAAVCPKCKSPYWNRPRKAGKGKPARKA